jgi:predicted alpha/beta-fold hydrolase
MNPAAHSSIKKSFRPHWLLAHPHIQSVLASKSPRRRLWLARGNRMEAVAKYHLLDAGGEVTLAGWHSRQPADIEAKGLVTLIHGWEGSHESTYLYSMACRLYDEGWNVFRLNLRDHGDTHHLNRELFHSARIEEVLGGIRAAQQIDMQGGGERPLVVIGFSLGGNFALRVGLQGPAQNVVPRLSIGICPSINPEATMQAIDSGSIIFRRYFHESWHETLRSKTAAWPGCYDFTPYFRIKSLIDSTRLFVHDFTEFEDLDAYFAAYTLTPTQLLNAPTPLAIITSGDDPVIPFRDFHGLRRAGSVVSYDVTARGGHCGFIENFAMETWTEKHVLQLLGNLPA